MVVTLMRRQPRRAALLFVAAIMGVALLATAGSMRPAHAVSNGSAYDVATVVDTNPDPDIVETTIIADEATVDVGNGLMANVQAFNGTVPGPEFRLKVGDTVIVHFENQLDEVTGIHWHGIELANASDGTPLVQNQVPPGGKFLYKYTVTRPGIFWYHPHHHASTNQVFKGLIGSIIVQDANELALQSSGVLPPESQTRTLALNDMTICKAPGSNDAATYDPTLPHVSDALLVPQASPTPVELCETAAIDDVGNPRGPFAAGDVPNVQKGGTAGRVNEGQTVLTNGVNVGGRAGDPADPGALAAGAETLDVQAGQGLRLRLGNETVVRFFRLILTDNAGVQIPLVRVGGQGGILDEAVVEGGVVNGFDFKYGSGEILLDPGDRQDVVVAIPPTATGVLTLWTQDFDRTGLNFSNIPTVPVAHFNVNGTAPSTYTIAAGTDLLASLGEAVETLGPPTATLLDPATFTPPKPGLSSQDIQLTATGASLGVDGFLGEHEFAGDFKDVGHEESARYAKLGDTLELTVTNTTQAHHPFHLHGFSIQPIELTQAASPSYVWPYREFRDNIDIPKGYTLRFRIRLDDRPLMDGVTAGGGLGRWVFHCHIFFHAVFGMISEFDVVAADGNEKPVITADNVEVDVDLGQTATNTGTFKDPDGDAVTLSASIGTVIDTGGGTWSWSFQATSLNDSQLVFITATDTNGLKDQVPFFVKVNNPCAGPAPAGAILGGAGNDVIDGTSGDDVIFDDAGNNTINGLGGNDLICTGLGNDKIEGGSDDDTIIDGGGNNSVNGGGGADLIIMTGSGNDKIDGGSDDDTIDAGDGNNNISGGSGIDSITAGPGNDKIEGGSDDDTIVAGEGNNNVSGDSGVDVITAGSGNDNIDGGAENDTIDAGDGNNNVKGGSGDDNITAGSGNDTIDGGAGFDTCIPGGGNNNVRNCEA